MVWVLGVVSPGLRRVRCVWRVTDRVPVCVLTAPPAVSCTWRRSCSRCRTATPSWCRRCRRRRAAGRCGRSSWRSTSRRRTASGNRSARLCLSVCLSVCLCILCLVRLSVRVSGRSVPPSVYVSPSVYTCKRQRLFYFFCWSSGHYLEPSHLSECSRGVSF